MQLKQYLSYLLLSSMLWSQKTLAQTSLSDLSCLSKPQKDAIAVSFQKNEDYEKRIANLEIQQTLFGWDWKILVWGIAAGAISGMVLEHQLSK
jgi:hypothetical protein